MSVDKMTAGEITEDDRSVDKMPVDYVSTDRRQ